MPLLAIPKGWQSSTSSNIQGLLLEDILAIRPMKVHHPLLAIIHSIDFTTSRGDHNIIIR